MHQGQMTIWVGLNIAFLWILHIAPGVLIYLRKTHFFYLTDLLRLIIKRKQLPCSCFAGLSYKFEYSRRKIIPIILVRITQVFSTKSQVQSPEVYRWEKCMQVNEYNKISLYLAHIRWKSCEKFSRDFL